MLGINDVVSYGTEGACKITEITHKDFGAGAAEYYVLRPVYRKDAVVFVPTGNKALVARMRRMISEDEIETIFAEMPEENPTWIQNENDRKVKYKEILTEGDSTKLVRMIKTLHFHQQEQNAKGRKLHMADERFFKEAEKILYDQFALALHIRPDEVLPFILKRVGANQESAENC